MKTNTELHPFERAGLGIAPFKFTGMEVKLFQACPGAPVKAGGTCDYCYTGIRDCYHIKSSDGKTFVVGCDCVNKLARTSNEKRDPVIAAIHREARRVKRERRVASETKRIKAAIEYFNDHRAEFEAQPHPKADDLEFFHDKTMADYYDWMFDRCGHTGRMCIARFMEKRQKSS